MMCCNSVRRILLLRLGLIRTCYYYEYGYTLNVVHLVICCPDTVCTIFCRKGIPHMCYDMNNITVLSVYAV